GLLVDHPADEGVETVFVGRAHRCASLLDPCGASLRRSSCLAPPPWGLLALIAVPPCSTPAVPHSGGARASPHLRGGSSRSSLAPRHAQSHRRNHVAQHLVDAATEGVDQALARELLDLAVQYGGVRVGADPP